MSDDVRPDLEVIDVIRAFTSNLPPFEAYLIGNVIKYTCRYKEKNGSTDLKKAAEHLAWAVQAAIQRERAVHEAFFVASGDPTAARSNSLPRRGSEPSGSVVGRGGTAQAPAAGLADQSDEGSAGAGMKEQKRFVCNRQPKTALGRERGPGCGWSSDYEEDRCRKCGGPMVPRILMDK